VTLRRSDGLNDVSNIENNNHARSAVGAVMGTAVDEPLTAGRTSRSLKRELNQ
jgi:hypothetical protein